MSLKPFLKLYILRFSWLRQHHVEALDILVSEYKHKVTGAVHYHLATNHDENVFLVAFRTQPMDSKGEAHILEHTALCGSEKFPVRDPFFFNDSSFTEHFYERLYCGGLDSVSICDSE